jgi:hypothetical protein
VPLIYFFIQHKVHKVAGGKQEHIAPSPCLTCHSLHYLRLL